MDLRENVLESFDYYTSLGRYRKVMVGNVCRSRISSSRFIGMKIGREMFGMFGGFYFRWFRNSGVEVEF